MSIGLALSLAHLGQPTVHTKVESRGTFVYKLFGLEKDLIQQRKRVEVTIPCYITITIPYRQKGRSVTEETQCGLVMQFSTQSLGVLLL